MTDTTKNNDEIKRFDQAIEALLNSRHLTPEITRAVFAYADGEITREQLDEAM